MLFNILMLIRNLMRPSNILMSSKLMLLSFQDSNINILQVACSSNIMWNSSLILSSSLMLSSSQMLSSSLFFF